MSKAIGIIMDPIESITYKKDTTLALMLAAQAEGWQIYYMEQSDLYLEQGRAKAITCPITVYADPNKWFEKSEPVKIELGTLDAILMRKDPPFDNEYIYSTYVLEAAERQGALVVNKPQSLRDCNEKIFATQFPQCCPPVLVSKNYTLLREFHQEHKDVIFKPLDGMGGSGIFRVREDDPNIGVILETLTNHGNSLIMVQKFIPQISDGDKRILVVNGQAVPYCLARIPAKGETRGNIAAGGTGRPQPLSERDQWIVDQVAPTLVEKGLFFVGLDVIGDYLTEINVTSPTCVREIDAAYDTNIGGRLMAAIKERLN
ncbi:glutathione synthase [Sessilibacter corallicola]|uniref:Glutathione synthetase n=1 Tax=Sessilibacter corallicola TaxID=2904075 RepID=A0ABQ0A5L7_9GAMM|nr:glutathione synthase [Sessilibacter corallicola]MCE2027720.1 glutathione synthase [Sessilibacter corallicola]